MRLRTEQRHDDLVETAFSLDDVPGILWTPTTPSPLVLLGHPGD